jgi:hypothetical protein
VRAVLAAIALSFVGALARADAAPLPSPLPSPLPPPLPSSLPPLDDELLAASPAPVAAFGTGRLRGVAVDDNGADDNGGDAAGAGWTARVGVAGDAGPLRGTIVVGEQGWWLGPTGPAQPGPALTSTPPLPGLLHATVAVPLAPLGLPARLVVGRLTPVVADGRFWGAEPFDARGRTSDGAVVDVDLGGGDHGARSTLSSGLFARLDKGGAPAGYAALSRRDDVVDVDVYLLGERDPAGDGVVRALLGSRAWLLAGPVQLRLGLDGLGALDDASTTTTTTTTVPAASWHGEAAFQTRLPWRFSAPRPFIDAGIEATGGDVRWTTPAPSVHGTQGALDLVDIDNTWQLRAATGVQGTGADEGFDVVVGWRHVGRLTNARPLSRPGGGPVAFTHVDEVDVDIVVPVADDATLQLAWSGAPLPSGFTQRFVVSLTFDIGDVDVVDAVGAHGPARLAPLVRPGDRAQRH